jgi:stalled ribosome rescue protein Dom34
MQLLNKKENKYEFLIESNDELWILSQFINSSDQIQSSSQRKVKIGDKNITKILFISLNVKNSLYYNNSLRISGKILNETEFTTIGQHHSLSFNVGDKITIIKNNLLKYEEKLINNALKTKKNKNLLVVLDKDTLILSQFSSFSYQILSRYEGLGSKKYLNEEIDEYKEKYEIIKDYLKKDYANIIFSGPFNFKNKLSEFIKKKMKIQISIIDFADTDNSSIQKIIDRIKEKGLIEDSQVAVENKLLKELLENINKGKKYTYGLENTKNAINQGLVHKLLISNKYIEKSKEEDNYTQLNELIIKTEKLNGELIIFNWKNDSSRVLEGLGGIAALLRY